MVSIPSYNRKTKKLAWSDEQKRILIKESKIVPLDELAVMVNKPVKATMRMCSRLGCGYFTREREEV